MEGGDFYRHQQRVAEYVDLPPPGYRGKPISENAFQSARCTIYFLLGIVILASQVCVALSIYQVYYLGPFQDVRCHITSQQIDAEMTIADEGGHSPPEFHVSGDFEVLGTTYTLYNAPISLVRFDLLLATTTTTQDEEHLVDVDFLIRVGPIEVRDQGKKAHESTTCFLRRSQLYLETTQIYDAMSTIFYVAIVYEVLLIIGVSYNIVRHCLRCCGGGGGGGPDKSTPEEEGGREVLVDDSKFTCPFNFCVLLRCCIFCGVNDRDRRRLVPQRF